MKMFSCLIVEDEPLAAEILQDYISLIPFLECKGVCSDSIDALQMLERHKIDVMFLDIHLPKIRGLEFLKMLKNPPHVILTTAYREYALDGYDLGVVDYLLKPINFTRFVAAVNKLSQYNDGDTTIPPLVLPEQQQNESLIININKKRIKIALDDILWVESKKDYLQVVGKEQTYTFKESMNNVEAKLPGERFLRIHRSFIVARSKIIAYGAAKVEIGKATLPIGRSYRPEVAKSLNGDASER